MVDTRPEIVYHYTSQKGFLSIVKTQKIRATDLLYLNDSSEFNIAVDIAKAQADELLKTLPSEDCPFITRAKALLNGIKEHHVYTCSFSAEGDSLSQWKLYGSNYRGFSIGFRLGELNAFFVDKAIRIQECLYDTQTQTQNMKDALTTSLDEFRKERDSKTKPRRPIEQIANDWAGGFYGRVMIEASRLKDSSFEPEREWRLVHLYDLEYNKQHASQAQFRHSAFSIIPYEEIQLPLNNRKGLSIAEIIMGPALNQDLTRRSLELLLTKYDVELAPLSINPSKIPIRDFS